MRKRGLAKQREKEELVLNDLCPKQPKQEEEKKEVFPTFLVPYGVPQESW